MERNNRGSAGSNGNRNGSRRSKPFGQSRDGGRDGDSRGRREGGRPEGRREGGFRPGGFGGQSRGFGERQSFKAVCSACNADCDLPFKPVEGRAVYCRDCFQKNKPENSRR